MADGTDAMWASIMNNNQWSNNPLYLILLLLFGGNINRNGCNVEQTITDNHNSDLIMGAIKGNADAARTLASSLNCDFNSLNSALNSLRSSMDLGHANLGSTFQNCCCQNQMATQKMGYENQISNLQQTNSLMSRIEQLANGITQGFSATAYATQQQTCDLKTNQNENTQRIIDTMNNHWNADLMQRYNDVRLEMSQLKQNQTLIDAMKEVAQG